MPDPLDALFQKASGERDPLDSLFAKAAPSRRPTGPGSAETPINEQHPGLSWWGRWKTQNLTGGDPDVAASHLDSLGFDVVKLPGFEFAIKKKGVQEPWRKVESNNWEWSDITDVAGGAFTTAGQIAGGVIGAGAGAVAGLAGGPAAPVTSPTLAVLKGAAGAAVGGAATEGILGGIGEMVGVRRTPMQHVVPALTEGAVGAAGEALAPVLSPILRPVVKTALAPLKYGAKKLGELGGNRLVEKGSKAIEGAMARGRVDEEAAKLSSRSEGLKFQRGSLDIDKADMAFGKTERSAERAGAMSDAANVRAETQEPIATLARARADLSEASLRGTKEFEAGRAAEAERAVVRKKTLEKELAEIPPTQAAATTPERAYPSPRDANVIEALEDLGRKPPKGERLTFSRGGSMLDPRYGWTAETLKGRADVADFFNEVFGENFLKKGGSRSIESRRSYLADIFRQKADDLPFLEGLNQTWAKKASQFFLTRDIAETLGAPAREALKRILVSPPITNQAGVLAAHRLANEVKILDDIVRSWVETKKVPEYLSVARKAYREALPPARAAQATRQEAATEISADRAGISARETRSRQGEGMSIAERERVLSKRESVLDKRKAILKRYELMYGKQDEFDPRTLLTGKLGLLRKIKDPILRAVGRNYGRGAGKAKVITSKAKKALSRPIVRRLGTNAAARSGRSVASD